MSEENTPETLRYYIDSVAGIQDAFSVVTAMLLAQYRGNAEAEQNLVRGLEHTRAILLGSKASEYKIEAFNQAAEALLESLKL